MKSDIKLHVRAKHFKDADFSSNQFCPIANSAREFFDNPCYINEGVNIIHIRHTRVDETMTFFHKHYGEKEFVIDAAKASKAKDQEKIIRTITLIP